MNIKCAGIITYNPDLDDLKKNINAIYHQTNDIYIIDNNSSNRSEIENMIVKYNKISFILFNKNFGVAKALNQIVDLAKRDGYDWVLLLDQDSVCDKNMLKKYQEFLSKHTEINIGLLTPYIVDINKMNIEEFYNLNLSDFNYVNFAITSGSLININICRRIGGFYDELFIDCVDFDFSKKLEIENIKQIRVNSTYLLQQVGHAEKTKLIRLHKDNAGKITLMPYYRTNHSLFRQYYIARNHIIMIKKYFHGINRVKQVFFVFCLLIAKLLVEKNKFKLLKTQFKGVLDGCKYPITCYQKGDSYE